MSTQAETDRGFCARLLPEVSRTFALSIEALPDGLSEAVRVAYLLCRIVDTVEDGRGPTLQKRLTLFAYLDELLSDDTRPPELFERLCRAEMGQVASAERELCAGAGAAFRRFRALPASQREVVRPHVQEMSRGMQEYLRRAGETGIQLTTVSELERYCYFVAGTVGQLLTGLFLQIVPNVGPDSRRIIEKTAVSFGLGLQLTNIVKDVATDRARGGHCFLPATLCEKEGLRPEHLLDSAHRDVALKVMQAVCLRAHGHLRQAQQYTEQWPIPDGLAIRQFCAVPLALALATLKEIKSGDDALRPGRTPKVSRETVAQVFREAQQAISSNEALGQLFDRHRP